MNTKPVKETALDFHSRRVNELNNLLVSGEGDSYTERGLQYHSHSLEIARLQAYNDHLIKFITSNTFIKPEPIFICAKCGKDFLIEKGEVSNEN